MSESFDFVEYIEELISKRIEYPTLRKGQVAFNVLQDKAPELAKEIRGTDLDPFYNDDKLEAFYNWLGEK